MEIPEMSWIATHSATAVAAVRTRKPQMLPIVDSLPGPDETISLGGVGHGDARAFREGADDHAVLRQLARECCRVLVRQPYEVGLAGSSTHDLRHALPFSDDLLRAF